MYQERKFGRAPSAPVHVGQELDVTIDAIGEKGDGIARVKGFVVFVPEAKKGQRVRVRINKVLSKVAFAEVIGEAKEPAPAEEAGKEPVPVPEPAAPAPEDTENFGEELGDTY